MGVREGAAGAAAAAPARRIFGGILQTRDVTDRRTDRRTDIRNLIKRCEDASKKAYEKKDIFGKRNMSMQASEFLDASSHLYKRVCPSVGPSIGRSVGNAFFFTFIKPRKTSQRIILSLPKWIAIISYTLPSIGPSIVPSVH